MAERLTKTSAGDAPLAQAKNPDARAVGDAGPDIEASDVIVGRTVTINRPREELYQFWRNFSNLPRFMFHIERIDVLDNSRSHWVVKAPAGKDVEWDSVITEDIPNELIAWATTDDAGVKNSGRVEFREAPGGRGTEMAATMVYDPPGGTVGQAIAKLFQREPKVQARQDLRRFKQLMETGEVATAIPFGSED